MRRRLSREKGSGEIKVTSLDTKQMINGEVCSSCFQMLVFNANVSNIREDDLAFNSELHIASL